MRLAVTDACIFIDLIMLELVEPFFRMPVEIHTTFDVFDELYPEQQQQLSVYQLADQLTIHNLTQEDKEKIQETVFPRALSDNDKTVIYLADKLHALLLSSDKPVRNYSKANSIEYHGMLWIFDKLLESNQITYQLAIQQINELTTKNIVYQNNMELTTEIAKRILRWELACK